MDNTNSSDNSFAKKPIISPLSANEPQVNVPTTGTEVSEQHHQGKDDLSKQISPPSQTINTEFVTDQSLQSNHQPTATNLNQQENSRALESVLKTINQGLKSRQFQGNLPLSVKIGSSVVFQAIPGKKPTINEIAPEQVIVLQKALENPQGVQGAVRLRVGGETVFHVKNGLLKVDKLGFSQQPSSDLSNRVSQPRSKSNSVKSAQSQSERTQLGQTSSTQPQSAQAQARLEEQIALLQATIERQQEKLDLITQKLEQFINSPTVIVVGNDQLKNWFSDLNFKIRQAGFQALANSNSQLEQNKATLLSKVKQLWAGAKEAVTDKVHATRNAIQATVSDLALDAVNATAKLASTVGEKLPDGTVVLESRSRNQRLDLSTSGVSLQGRSPIDPAEQWNKFSQGIEGVAKDRPVQYSLAVARNAVRHGMSRTSIEDMLVADPQYQKILTELGHNEAQKYAKQTARSAERREQPSLKAQQERQRSFGNSLQR